MVRLLCSCDRYNYGDLLFPIVTSRALGVPVEVYGLVRSDLSAFGALPSKSMGDLYNDTREGDVVLLAGGENLAQTWFVMYLTLLSADAAQQWIQRREIIGGDSSERISRLRLQGRQQFPYILPRDQFGPGVRVLYNSVGGWPLEHYSGEDRGAIARTLSQASYLSVREEASAAILRGLDPPVSCEVAPDCVFLLPDLFPKPELAARSSAEVRALVEDAGAFLCFQCHPRYGDANRAELTRQLRTLIEREHHLNVMLTPIARMHSFEDDRFLASLASELGDRARVLPASAGIFDITYTLASSRLFCGTSLHGVITALSFGVAVVPLASDDPKLQNNVASWGLADLFPQARTDELAAHAWQALSLTSGVAAEHASRLARDARANMARLRHVVDG